MRIRNLILLCLLAFVSGCGTRVVYVRPQDPVRLRAEVKAAAVWVRDGKGEWTPGTVTLPEGGYYVQDPGEEPR